MSTPLCELCFKTELLGCDSPLEIGGLEPYTAYYFFLEDKFGNNYTGQFQTDIGGNAVIDFTNYELPEGFFTPYSGEFEFSVSTSDTEKTFEDLLIGYAAYPCIIFSIKKLSDINP